MENLAHDPADIPAPASYHWTPRLQRDFLEHIATTGSVTISAARVGMSPAAEIVTEPVVAMCSRKSR